jgi:hypothetical protein
MIRILSPINFVFPILQAHELQGKSTSRSQIHNWQKMSMSYPTLLASDPRARMLEVSARVDLLHQRHVWSNHPVVNQFGFCLTLSNNVIVHAIPKLCNNTASKERADLNQAVTVATLASRNAIGSWELAFLKSGAKVLNPKPGVG